MVIFKIFCIIWVVYRHFNFKFYFSLNNDKKKNKLDQKHKQLILDFYKIVYIQELKKKFNVNLQYFFMRVWSLNR